MSVKIIEPIRNYLKEFNTPEEFNNFYLVNKDALNQLTTHKLNKMYHVKGYRITKIKNELMLKRWDEGSKEEEPKFASIDKVNSQEERLSSSQKELESLKGQLQQMRNENPNRQLQELKMELSKFDNINSKIERLESNIHKINMLENSVSKINMLESSINKIEKYDKNLQEIKDEQDKIKEDIKKIKGTITDMIKFINENLSS